MIDVRELVPKYLAGNKIKVWSYGGIPVDTEVTRVMWDDLHDCWRYYFKVEDKEYWEVENAITKI